jgi:hypothetical protein
MSEYMIHEEEFSGLNNLIDLVSNKKLDQKIDQLLRQIEASSKELYGEAGHKEYFELITDSLNSGEINRSYISDEQAFLILNKATPTEKQARIINLAVIYTHTAIKLNEHNEIILAWHAVSEASYFVGLQDGLFDPTAQKKIQRASKGGQANAKKISNFKKSIIEALTLLRPEKGWSSASKATDKVVAHLINSPPQEKSSQPQNREDLTGVVLDMITTDKDVIIAFNTPATENHNL